MAPTDGTPPPGRLGAWAAAILRRRWIVLALALLAMLAAAAGGRFLTVSNDYRILLGDGNPQLAALDSLQAAYTEANPVTLAVAPRDGAVFTAEALGAIEDLTEAAWLLPYSRRVDSLTNHFHTEAEDDDLIVEPLVDGAAALDEADLARIRGIALGTPELAGRLVSRDGRVGGVVVDFVLPADQEAGVREINARLDAVLAEARARHPDLDYHATGEIVMNRAFSTATEEDFAKLIPIAFVLIVALSAVVLRSAFAAVAVVVSIVFAVATAMGIAGWAGAVLTPISAYIPIVVMAITVASSIHIVAEALAGLRRGLDRFEAAANAVRVNFYPVFLTSLTTAVGFLSLNFSELSPFHTLGNFTTVGVVCGFVYSMTLLPALLTVLPLRAKPAAGGGGRGVFDRLGDFVVARRTALFWCAGLVAAGLVSGVPRIELSENFTKYFDESHPLRRDTDFIQGNLSGLLTLEYSLESGAEGGIADPGYLETIDRFAEWYRQQPGVDHVWVFSDVMKRLNKNMHGDDPEYHRLPDNRDLASQYLLLYELSLPFGRDLNNNIDVSKSATRMVVALGDLSTPRQREVADSGYEWLRANAPDLASRATGLSVVFAHLADRSIESMLLGTAIALSVVSLILFFVFRSLRFGFVSLVPNFVPPAMALGLWGYAVGTVGMASAVFTAIAFGIVVDDTIHFMTKYLRARREQGLAPAEAVRATFAAVGPALWTTTVALVIGFLVFTVSGFQASWALGLLVAIVLVFALLADFLLLPPLLMLVDRRKP